METILALVIVAAVIFFGALISVSNERQRRAFDAAHQAYKQWAVQDLCLKRGAVSSQTRIEDLTAWLTKVTSLAFGRKMTVMDYQLHTTSVATVALHNAEGGAIVICALESPGVLIPRLRERRLALRVELRANPLFRIGKKTPVVELSMLNAGKMFEMEFPVAWNAVTGQITEAVTLWAYILN